MHMTAYHDRHGCAAHTIIYGAAARPNASIIYGDGGIRTYIHVYGVGVGVGWLLVARVGIIRG